MVTTRIEAVAVACSDASEICGDNIYHIEPLNSEDSKKLFLSRAFGSKDASCPTELEDEMNKILKKCGGLPLAIVSIGSLLASYKSAEHKDMWDRVCKSISYHMDTNPTLDGMRQILTLSYDHLPYHLKGCMMYLSIFPEDFLINKDRLVYRWIAEGLVEEKRGMTLLEVAEAYYEELVSRGMINPAGEIISHVYGAVETCRVHDLMLEVMVSKSLEANFVSLIGGQYDGMSYDTIRRLSVHAGGQRPKESPSNKDSPSKKTKESTSKKMVKKNDLKDINVQHVRSLSMFQLEGNKLLDRLGEFTLLRVLDLEDCKGVENKHMSHICRMYLLRYLSLRGTDISVLPTKVCDLEHLQTLDVRATGLARLPETLIKLEDDAVEVAQEVGELENLQRLSIYVDCERPNGPKVLEELALSLSKTHSLRSLDMGTMSYEANALNFLLELPSPPRLLRFLRIAGGIDKLPNWVESLTYLVEFHMSWAHFIDDQLFGVLCKLPNLKSIWMQRNCYTGRELVARAAHNFPALKNLRGTCDQEMPRVYKFEEGSMTKLEKLSLNFDNWSEKSIVGIEHLTSLKEVQLAGKRGNPALDQTLELLKAESGRHPNHFTVGVKYD
ncbi:unnamed protein product [Triticum turgidum subsp. durum]|uniref:NB-ARC domain-containing protein n=1 Tax=Triticum turgidum subsp. durum TaxID=4567 RepID=A0A9R0Z2C5_TRITD|nr:unnamed protein product [Triticum turgidum subsp. durum]